MAAKNENAPTDDVDRLKKVAFWYWEYMRRNSLYKKYCKAFDRYNSYFKSIGVYEFMQTKEYLDEMSAYVSTHTAADELEHTPFKSRLERDHGEEAGKLYFKFGFLSYGYDLKFGRVYKDCNYGIDPEEALTSLLKDEPVPCSLKDAKDLSALVKLNGSWLVNVDDCSPTIFSYDLERSSNISIDPRGILADPGKVALEVHALNIINKAVNSLFDKQHVSEETLQSIYKLSLSGKHINSSDVMRLAMLWLWDKAHERNERNPASFDEVYPLLKAKIEKAGVAGGAWEQIATRRKRILGYYAMTDHCIKNCTVTSLNQ